MLRNVLLFSAAVLLALTAGRAFWVSLGESPFNVSGATYIEFFQQVDRRIAIPLAVTGIGGTLLAGLSALTHKADRRTLHLLLAACGCGVVGSLVTILVNVPINERVATWNPAALPTGYEDFLRRWRQWHQVRLVVMFAGMCLVFAAMLTRKARFEG
jgi:uncharacterized membrane protein